LKGSLFGLLIATTLLCSKFYGIKTTKRIDIDALDIFTGNPTPKGYHSANDLLCFSTHAFTFVAIPLVDFYLSDGLFDVQALSEDELATDDKHSSDTSDISVKDVSKPRRWLH